MRTGLSGEITTVLETHELFDKVIGADGHCGLLQEMENQTSQKRLVKVKSLLLYIKEVKRLTSSKQI